MQTLTPRDSAKVLLHYVTSVSYVTNTKNLPLRSTPCWKWQRMSGFCVTCYAGDRGKRSHELTYRKVMWTQDLSTDPLLSLITVLALSININRKENINVARREQNPRPSFV